MELPKEFGYVAGTAVASWFVHHMYMAFKARKQFDVKYPALYADATNCPNEANRKSFNCVQRGHQNSLETLPTFLGLLAITGLKHPVTASGLGCLYLVGRVCYFNGYSTGDPDKRVNAGTLAGYIGLFGLVGTAIKIAASAFAK
ncbi:microsomal glutathione S-transferase [Raphidocelis subcapitata]|uniref:Glutathione S-transferase 3, mitochondrial n=1 Tax=Raphidocelis subcapitata TaxID=307507 RepID=A0A2V0P234_9CHLO|nr:microsomal glutathione S-transferase [Raphidocelis subcapitata]|eukprot:GBF93639.1 microsomal glutathione S-transferase [Raphidocelis subcapitata]